MKGEMSEHFLGLRRRKLLRSNAHGWVHWVQKYDDVAVFLYRARSSRAIGEASVYVKWAFILPILSGDRWRKILVILVFFIPQIPIFIKLVILTYPGGEFNSTQTDGLALLGCSLVHRHEY